MTIRQQLTVRFSVIVGILIVFFSGTVYFFSASYRQEEFFGRLEEKAHTVAKLFLEVEEVDQSMLMLIRQNSRDRLPQEIIQIYDSTYRIIFETDTQGDYATLLAAAKETQEQPKIEKTVQGNQIISFPFEYQGRHYTIVATAYDKYGYSKLTFLRNILISGCLVAVMIAIIMGFIYARQALNPLNDLVHQVRTISAPNLDQRVVTQNPEDEIGKLATEFNRMLDRVEDAFALQRSFVANASHELRTPLTAITGEISVALIDDKLNPEVKTILRSVYQDIRELNRLTNGLIDLAQANLDENQLMISQVRIDELIGSCRADLKKINPAFDVPLVIKKFPEDERQLMVMGNEMLLKSAILNIIENGCKYSTDKMPDLILDFLPGKIRFEVCDQGIGIPPDDLLLIFEPFYRGRNTNRVQGHGIGLTLSKRIIENHKGSIEINSQEGLGTSVVITLPAIA